ncbi:MAG TPA: helix-turn-helix domain-containing protein [Acidimicrobiia bacterium]|nr:helix-turn-helix domain-containing protein [Acidimicrobiia bacterium]
MARPAPAVERVVSVLNFLAAHPGEDFSLSELSRRLDLNKATAHSMLNALADAGYILRHPARLTFSLGPALIALGNAAQGGGTPVVEFARDEMRQLADRLGLECLATQALGDEIVIVARSGVPRTGALNGLLQVGQRLPLVPPLGTVFKAWAPPREVERWLALLGRDASPDEVHRYGLGLEAARGRGYVVGLEADPRATLGQALRQLAGDERAAPSRRVVESLIDDLGHEDYILVELDASADYFVNHLVAPVFGPAGDVALALSLFGFPARLSGQEVARYGEALRDACNRVTKSIHGREPDRR